MTQLVSSSYSPHSLDFVFISNRSSRKRSFCCSIRLRSPPAHFSVSPFPSFPPIPRLSFINCSILCLTRPHTCTCTHTNYRTLYRRMSYIIGVGFGNEKSGREVRCIPSLHLTWIVGKEGVRVGRQRSFVTAGRFVLPQAGCLDV